MHNSDLLVTKIELGTNSMVNSTNMTTGNGKLPPEVVQQIIIMSFFTALALTGNIALLIHSVRIRAWTRSVSNFVMALALTDVSIAIFSMSVEILWEAFHDWIFGYYACKVAPYIQCMLFISTAFIHMSMSYDRYQAVCCPMLFSQTVSRSRKMIIGSWLAGIFLAIPQLFIFVQVQIDIGLNGSPIYACKSDGYTAAWQRKIYVTWIAVCIFIIPLGFVAFCYVNIARVLWQRSSAQRRRTQWEHVECLGVDSSIIQKSAKRAKIRTVKLTICILACYMFCWTPYFSMTLLNVWTDYRYKKDIPSIVKTIAQSLAWFSSCVNPVIYGGLMIPEKALYNSQNIFTSHLQKGEELSKAKCRGLHHVASSPVIPLAQSKRIRIRSVSL